MTEPVRFPANLPYVDSEPCLEVFAAMVAGDWDLARQRYDANPTATSNTMGAVRYWRDQFQPPAPVIIDVPPFGQGQPRIEIPNFSNQVYAFRFVVPDGPPLPVVGYSSVFEYKGAPYLRQACLSIAPGDYSNPIGYVSQGMQASVFWTRGAPLSNGVLPAGTYYFNVRNSNAPTDNYPAMVEFSWPR